MAAEANVKELQMKVEWTKEGLIKYWSKLVETEQPQNGALGSENWAQK